VLGFKGVGFACITSLASFRLFLARNNSFNRNVNFSLIESCELEYGGALKYSTSQVFPVS
jgi:hypothetical protein